MYTSHTYISKASGPAFSEGWFTSEVNLEQKKQKYNNIVLKVSKSQHFHTLNIIEMIH